MKHTPKTKFGFSLVELIVTIAISSIMLTGLSIFFLTGMSGNVRDTRNLNIQEDSFILQNMLQKHLENIELVLPTNFVSGDNLLAKNFLGTVSGSYTSSEYPPFSLIKLHEKENQEGILKNKLVIHDFVSFPGIALDGATLYYADTFYSGIVRISDALGFGNDLLHPTGLVLGNGVLYIADTGNKRIVKSTDFTNINEIDTLSHLIYPTGLAYHAGYLFIADSVDNRILRYDINDDKLITFAGTGEKGNQGDGLPAEDAAFNFPTGLAVSSDGEFLYVADSLNNKVRIIELNTADHKITTLVGGNVFSHSSDCEKKPARTCNTHFPTGLSVRKNSVTGVDELFIADTKNNRILKVYDPGEPELIDGNIDFTVKIPHELTLSKIQVEYPEGDLLEIIFDEIRTTCYFAPPPACLGEPGCVPLNTCPGNTPGNTIITTNSSEFMEQLLGNRVNIQGTGYTIQDVLVDDVTLTPDLTGEYPPGALLELERLNVDTEIPIKIPVDLETISGMQAIKVTVVAEEPGKSFSEYIKIVNGDAKLGTADDFISVEISDIGSPATVYATDTDIFFTHYSVVDNDVQFIVRNKDGSVSRELVSIDVADFEPHDKDFVMSDANIYSLYFEHDIGNRILSYKMEFEVETTGSGNGVAGSVSY